MLVSPVSTQEGTHVSPVVAREPPPGPAIHAAVSAREGTLVWPVGARGAPPVPAIDDAGRRRGGGRVPARPGRAARARRRGERRRAASGLGRAVLFRPAGPDPRPS